MHPVLAGAEIDRADGQPLDHGAHLVEGEPVDPRRVAVAERAGQVALVREPDAQRELRGSLGGAAGGSTATAVDMGSARRRLLERCARACVREKTV